MRLPRFEPANTSGLIALDVSVPVSSSPVLANVGVAPVSPLAPLEPAVPVSPLAPVRPGVPVSPLSQDVSDIDSILS